MNREIKRAHTHIMSIITQLVIDTKFQYSSIRSNVTNSSTRADVDH